MQLLQDIKEAAEFKEKTISVHIAATERLEAPLKLFKNKDSDNANVSLVLSLCQAQ